MNNLLKKQQGFTLIELMIVIAIVAIIMSIAIPAYQDYMTKTKWGKTIAGTRALKLAVENCLSDNSGAFPQCDSVDPTLGKIAAYGVTQYAAANGDFLGINMVQNTAEIQIAGDTALASCTLTIHPTYSSGAISWSYLMTASSAAQTTKCQTYVKGSISS